ncbi:MAG: PAS domain S-box protein, partial [Methanoregula sp.]
YVVSEDMAVMEAQFVDRRDGIKGRYECKLMKRDGTIVWTLISGSPLFDNTGFFEGSFGMISDITEQKTAENSLREGQMKLTEAMDLAHMVEWELDPQRNIFTFNDRFYDFLCTTSDREGGYQMRPDVYFREFVHPDDRTRIAEEIEQGRKIYDPHHVSKVEHRIVRRDGEIRYIVVIYERIRDKDGHVIKIQGVSQDITDRRKMEEAIEKANKQISLLTSITRHDILNQLTMLQGYISRMKRDSCDDTFTGIIQKEEEIAKTIHNQIIFTRIYQNVGVQPPQWKNVKESIAAALATANIGNVSVVLDTGTLEVYADLLIEKVFFNLIENALKHGEKVTQICVSYRKTEKEVILAFEDDGIGIPEEEKDRIFTRGYGKTTGYGLFLAREILAITGIAIQETGEPGKGARFEIMVPEGTYRFHSSY